MAKKQSIGRAEVDILRFIADHPGITVAAVGDHLMETKGQTRTTALNTMERLRTKGFLKRKQVRGVYQYFPVEGKHRMFEGLVDDFVETMLGGSVTPLVAYLTKKVEADPSEIAELKKLLEKLEGEDVS